VVETAQFGTSDPSHLPHPIAGVGDRDASGHGANWIPALRTLLAVRGNRWLTISYSVAGQSGPAALAAAATLARPAFHLTAN
jgi:hypothetical protein